MERQRQARLRRIDSRATRARSSVSLMASPRRAMPTGTLTFLFSDIEGFDTPRRVARDGHLPWIARAAPAPPPVRVRSGRRDRAVDRGRLVLRRLPRRAVGGRRRCRGAARPRGRDLAGWRAGARQDGPSHRPGRRRRRRLCRDRRPPCGADRRSSPRRPGHRLGVDPRPRPVGPPAGYPAGGSRRAPAPRGLRDRASVPTRDRRIAVGLPAAADRLRLGDPSPASHDKLRWPGCRARRHRGSSRRRAAS